MRIRSSVLLRLVFTAWSCCVSGQVIQHSATIQITDPQNPVGSQYNIFRVPGIASAPVGQQCPSTLSFPFGSLIAGPIGLTPVNPATPSVMEYTDKNLTTGTWCYAVSAHINGVDGPLSNFDGGTLNAAIPFPPSIMVVIK